MNFSEVKCKISGDIFYKNQVDSTNNWAKRFYLEHQKELNAVFIADMQTHGKGRLGREWLCESGKQINMSILLFPQNNVDNLQMLCLCSALAVYNSIKELINIPCQIKWPNDILINNRKVCGILCESVFLKSNRPASIVGIGVNVKNDVFPSSLADKVTSLFLESYKIFSRSTLINSILDKFYDYYNKFSLSEFDDIITEYKSICTSINKSVKISIDGKTTVGTAIDINNWGDLIVQLDSGKIIPITHGEIVHQNI